jgi:hypothetical protein
MNKDNNSESPIFLCNNNDDKCKKLIEMANAIVLDKLLKDSTTYTNKNNEIATSILNNNINESTHELILPAMTEKEREDYENKNYIVTKSELGDYMNNLGNNGVYTGGQYISQDMDMPHIPKGGNILKRKSYKKTQHKKAHKNSKNRKTHKKSKRIRKI